MSQDATLKRNGLLTALRHAATDEDRAGPCNILLAGPWGAGKTTLLEGLGETIKKSNASIHVFVFSPWNTAADGDPGKAFLRVLHGELVRAREQLQQQNDGNIATRIDGYLDILQDLLKQNDVRAILDALVPGGKPLAIVVGGLAGLARKLLGVRNGSTEPSGIEGLREKIRQLLDDVRYAHGKQRILLLVDDLDRARPEEAISILDDLYHLFLPHTEDIETWPLTSVWAVNTAVLEEYLYREYRDLPSFDPNAYLEKLFSQRINVPPLFYVGGEDGDRNEAYWLWQGDLQKRQEKLDGINVEEVAFALTRDVNYAILGNLRLHARLRRDCLRLWTGGTRLFPLVTQADYVRQARLLTLVDAFAVFRERIAPYNGMWPVFLNQLNRRWAEQAVDWIANPLYRHTDSPDLATLLKDLGAIRYDGDRACYALIPEGRLKLQAELNILWTRGV